MAHINSNIGFVLKILRYKARKAGRNNIQLDAYHYQGAVGNQGV